MYERQYIAFALEGGQRGGGEHGNSIRRLTSEGSWKDWKGSFQNRRAKFVIQIQRGTSSAGVASRLPKPHEFERAALWFYIRRDGADDVIAPIAKTASTSPRHATFSRPSPPWFNAIPVAISRNMPARSRHAEGGRKTEKSQENAKVRRRPQVP